ncbi:hypothetical protein [Stieleria maiorica]|uniref:hypothetical protein n=1 Tax=Stieleria maiorica TaxID=2795974 RepID=UPI001F2156F9|nr:hypothetical protein [Stieleria maiorica]
MDKSRPSVVAVKLEKIATALCVWARVRLKLHGNFHRFPWLDPSTVGDCSINRADNFVEHEFVFGAVNDVEISSQPFRGLDLAQIGFFCSDQLTLLHR